MIVELDYDEYKLIIGALMTAIYQSAKIAKSTESDDVRFGAEKYVYDYTKLLGKIEEVQGNGHHS